MKTLAQRLDISPSTLLAPACHGPTDVPARASKVPFEANIVILKERDNTLVIVSLDWFFVSPGIRHKIISHCHGRLQEAQLVVAASHAHTSPNADATKRGRCSQVDAAYVEAVETSVAERVAEMMTSGSFQEGRMRFAAVACEYTISRRKQILVPQKWGFGRKTKLYPNAEASRDRELRVLRVEDKAGRLLAVIWGASCHPTEYPALRELSPDYPGGVRTSLRKELGDAQLPVVFLQGFCGDLRPPALGRWLRREKLVMTLAMGACGLLNGPFFAGFSQSGYDTWVKRMAECALQGVKDAAGNPEIVPTLRAQRTRVPLAKLGLSSETSDITFHSFDFGDRVKVFGVSAEICWDYADMLRNMLPQDTIWPLAYNDTVYGYLPTQAMVPLGGYEVTGYKGMFGVTGDLVPQHDEIIRKAFLHQTLD